MFHVDHSDFLESDLRVIQFSVEVIDLFCRSGYTLQKHMNYNYSYENTVQEADETKMK